MLTKIIAYRYMVRTKTWAKRAFSSYPGASSCPGSSSDSNTLVNMGRSKIEVLNELLVRQVIEKQVPYTLDGLRTDGK